MRKLSSNEVEALALLYVQQQGLSDKTVEEAWKMYVDIVHDLEELERGLKPKYYKSKKTPSQNG